MTADAPRPFPDLPERVRTIHIIGICGTAMGSLAAMLVELGYEVRGSDQAAYPPMSDWLEARGIDILRGYNQANLEWDPDLVIVGNVVRPSYGDALGARQRGLPQLSLPEALRHFVMRDKRRLVIAGTHGKTTTTSMLAWILHEAGRDPGFMVGGITGNFGSNFRLSDGEAFVIEGDEYDTAYFDKVPKFWHYGPFRATINNVEFDHADIYPDLQAVEHVFRRFVDRIPPEGSLWVGGDDERALAVSAHARCPRRTFGTGPSCELRAHDLRLGRPTRYRATMGDEDLGEFRLPTLGAFNVRNALGATALALDEGVDLESVRRALSTFRAVKKRQEFIGEVDDILVYDDFAHHPTAVGATVQAMRSAFPGRRLWAIFEAKSNTSRRRVFQHAYAPALAQADHVILSQPWKEDADLPPEQLLDIDELRQSIEDLGPPCELIAEIDDIVTRVADQARPGDVIVGLSGSAFGGLHHKIIAALTQKSTP